MKTLEKFSDFEKIISGGNLVLFYLSQPSCKVCKSLLPKVDKLMELFQGIESYYIDLEKFPRISGQTTVFTIPTILFFAAGKEQFRLSRNFSLNDLESKIERINSFFIE